MQQYKVLDVFSLIEPNISKGILPRAVLPCDSAQEPPMKFQVSRDFENADADSLKIELFCDRDHIVRGWYIGPLVKTAKELVLPFCPRERNLRAETAIARVVQIALAADLPVTLIDPHHLWEGLWFSEKRTDPFAASLEDRRPRRRQHDLLAARDNRADEPRPGDDRDDCSRDIET